MSSVMSVSLGIGICCAIYPLLAGIFDISVWMSFAGCTSYYVAGGGAKGFVKSTLSNFSGLAWAMLVIAFGTTSIMQNSDTLSIMLGALATGFIAFSMTYQSQLKVLSFVPCSFIGCFSAFGSGGDWKMMIVSILGGNLLGLSCDYLGKFIAKLFEKESQSETIES